MVRTYRRHIKRKTKVETILSKPFNLRCDLYFNDLNDVINFKNKHLKDVKVVGFRRFKKGFYTPESRMIKILDKMVVGIFYSTKEILTMANLPLVYSYRTFQRDLAELVLRGCLKSRVKNLGGKGRSSFFIKVKDLIVEKGNMFQFRGRR